MATKLKVEPRGSWVLKGIIAVLIIVLIFSVMYPDKLWKEHQELISDSQERMENLNLVVNRFYAVNGNYISDLDSLIKFIDDDSVTVERSLFEVEKLSLYDANYDSFLVGFIDDFHFDHIDVIPFKNGQQMPIVKESEEAGIDSILLRIIPKDAFADVVAPVESYMKAGKGLKYYFRGKGDKDIYWMVWSPGKIERDYLPYEEKVVPSKEYLLFRDLADLKTDPITKKDYQINLNKKIVIEGKIDYVIPKRGEPDPPVLGNELKTNLLLNRIARKARARLDQDMQRDSTLFEQQLALQGDYFDVEMDLIRPGRPVNVESDREFMVPADSVDVYRNPERIKAELYKVQFDSLTKSWAGLEKFQNIVNSMEFKESLELTEEKIVGVTIRPLFEGRSMKLESKNVLESIFSIGPIDHPGFVENNDLSWSETK